MVSVFVDPQSKDRHFHADFDAGFKTPRLFVVEVSVDCWTTNFAHWLAQLNQTSKVLLKSIAENNMDKRVDDLNMKTDDLYATIENLGKRMDYRIKDLDRSLNEKVVDGLNKRINDKVDELYTSLNRTLMTIWNAQIGTVFIL